MEEKWSASKVFVNLLQAEQTPVLSLKSQITKKKIKIWIVTNNKEGKLLEREVEREKMIIFKKVHNYNCWNYFCCCLRKFRSRASSAPQVVNRVSGRTQKPTTTTPVITPSTIYTGDKKVSNGVCTKDPTLNNLYIISENENSCILLIYYRECQYL